MSLLSSIILPALEKELIASEPVIAEFALKQLHKIGQQLMTYAESKIGVVPTLPAEDKSEEN